MKLFFFLFSSLLFSFIAIGCVRHDNVHLNVRVFDAETREPVEASIVIRPRGTIDLVLNVPRTVTTPDYFRTRSDGTAEIDVRWDQFDIYLDKYRLFSSDRPYGDYFPSLCRIQIHNKSGTLTVIAPTEEDEQLKVPPVRHQRQYELLHHQRQYQLPLKPDERLDIPLYKR